MSETINSIDSYINNLQYDSSKILVNNSNVPTYKKEDGILQSDGTFLVIKKKQCTVHNNSSELTYMDALASRLFPGVMVLCNSNLIENNPKIVDVDTKATKFSIDLPNGATSFEIPKIVKSELDSAINHKIVEWKNANPQGNIIAKIKYNLYEVKNKHKLSADLGFNLAMSKQTFGIDFHAIENSETRDWILKFEQIYYNVSLDSFQKPSNIIADSVSTDDLKNLGVNNENPIGIINNVSYGRIVYVHFSTTNKELNLNAKLDLILNDRLDANAIAEFQKLKKEVSLNVFVYGGGTSTFNTIPQINIDTLHTFIKQGYNFDATQLAAPIGYSVIFMKNSGQELATVNNTSTYIETTVERYDKAHLRIEQKGAFINRFHITWNELTYNPDGSINIESKQWERNGKDSLAGQKYDLFFNGNVRNLHINSKGLTGIIWDKTRTNYDCNVALKPEMTLIVSGTTLRQKAVLQ